MELIKDLGMHYPTEKSTQKRRFGLYVCGECGNEVRVRIDNVRYGNTTKCINCASMVTHGDSYTELYGRWKGMIERCQNRKYKNYHGRGITVCDEWKKFSAFKEWAYSNGFSKELWLDRIDNDGNYEPSNCRWATPQVQQRNRRRIFKNNKSGYRGVYLHKESNKYLSRIGVNNTLVYLGSFDNPIDGALAYDRYIDENNLEHTKNFD